MAKKNKAKTADVTTSDKTTEVKTSPKTFALAQMARDNGKNEKAVRGRFRKMYDREDPDPKLPKTVKGGSRWVFAETDREAVLALVVNVSSDE